MQPSGDAQHTNDEVRSGLEAVRRGLERIIGTPREVASRRRWAACLLPFLRELGADRAIPFRRDLIALGLTPESDLEEAGPQAVALARRWGLPYARAWGQVLVIPFFLPSQPELLPALPSDVAFVTGFNQQFYLLSFTEFPSAAVLLEGGSQASADCVLRIPPAELSQREREAIVARQIRSAFHQIWRTWRRPGVSPLVRIHNRAFAVGRAPHQPAGGDPVWPGAYRDLRLRSFGSPQRTREDGARSELVQILLKELPPAPTPPADWLSAGQPPDWDELAQWWALRRFERKTAEDIARCVDPESLRYDLPRKVTEGLRFLRSCVER
jgi:hypothetical protein